jgi:hypothetical protein
VILGLHAPLFNPWAESYPYFLRETQRPALEELVWPFLTRFKAWGAAAPPALRQKQTMLADHPSWFAPSGQAAPSYVKRGDNADLFDYGVSRGSATELLRLITGIGSRRRADVVLQGHVHRVNEFRLDVVNGEPAFFMDFYTRNPGEYYPTRFPTGKVDLLRGMATEVTRVRIVDGAPADRRPAPLEGDSIKYTVDVPPYPKPLATTRDARGWWEEHRPLVLQTEALGPVKDADRSFEGFRVLTVQNDVIDKIDLVPIRRLHDNGYRLPWERARA